MRLKIQSYFHIIILSEHIADYLVYGVFAFESSQIANDMGIIRSRIQNAPKSQKSK